MSFDDVAKRMQERHQGDYGADLSGAPSSTGGGGEIVLGAILLIAGLLITGLTYGQASRQGGVYVVAYGPIVFGVIKIIRGLSRS